MCVSICVSKSYVVLVLFLWVPVSDFVLFLFAFALSYCIFFINFFIKFLKCLFVF